MKNNEYWKKNISKILNDNDKKQKLLIRLGRGNGKTELFQTILTHKIRIIQKLRLKLQKLHNLLQARLLEMIGIKLVQNKQVNICQLKLEFPLVRGNKLFTEKAQITQRSLIQSVALGISSSTLYTEASAL